MISVQVNSQIIDFEDFNTPEKFTKECDRLSGTELIFSEWQGIPEKLLNTSINFVNAQFWEWILLPEQQRNLIASYWKNVDSNKDIDYILFIVDGMGLNWIFDQTPKKICIEIEKGLLTRVYGDKLNTPEQIDFFCNDLDSDFPPYQINNEVNYW